MKITFKNLSAEHIELTLADKKEIIPSGGVYHCNAPEGELTFFVNPYEKSDLKYIFRRAGVVGKKSFCTLSIYSLNVNSDTVINLFTDKAKGKFGDEFRRVVAVCDSSVLSLMRYCVADEESVRKEFDSSKKKGNRALFIFDVFDIIGNAFTVLLLLLIPFALIWIFGSFETAYKICGTLFVPVFVIIVVINRTFDKYKKKLWYFAKSKALKNEIYKGTDSYFSDEYIREVFRNKQQ